MSRRIFCAAPIRTVTGEIIGVVQALNKKKGRFTKDDLAFARSPVDPGGGGVAEHNSSGAHARFQIAGTGIPGSRFGRYVGN